MAYSFGMNSSSYIPLFFNLNAVKCLVVGAGASAQARALQLSKYGAEVSSILVEIFQSYLLSQYRLVIVATDDDAMDHEICQEVKAAGILVYCPDKPHLSSFNFGAVYQQGDLTVAVSTNGISPSVAQHVRDTIAVVLDKNYEQILLDLAVERQKIKSSTQSLSVQKQLMREAALQKLDIPRGEVAFVGAGPGDIEHLTLKALKLILTADVVVYDLLVDSEIVALAPKEAKKICIRDSSKGKKRLEFDYLSDVMITAAKNQQRVVRLKCGDPSIFGQLTQEIAALVAAQVTFQVIPGVTSACAAAAHAQVSLTSRKRNSSVGFVTGVSIDEPPDFARLFRVHGVLVIYMGLSVLPAIVDQLMSAECSPTTPITIISNAGRACAHAVYGTLEDICGVAERHHCEPPATIIIGDVA